MVTFAMIETGVLWWLKTGMQLTASMTARCGAIGLAAAGVTNNLTNFACSNSATTTNYAVSNVAASWGLPGITNADVTLGGSNGKVTACNGFTGNFFQVTLSHQFLNFPPPLGGYSTLASTACYPMQ